jgi:hypothetical protein
MKNKLMILAVAALTTGAAISASESTGKITGHELIDKHFCDLVAGYLITGKKSGVTITKNAPFEGYTDLTFKESKKWRDWNSRGREYTRHHGHAETDKFIAAFEKCVKANPNLVEKLKQEVK